MKRKILSLLFITAVVAALAVCAFAEDSQSGTVTDTLPTSTNGQVEIAPIADAAVRAEAEATKTSATALNAAKALVAGKAQGDPTLTVATMFNYEGPHAKGQQVAFTSVPGVVAGDYVVTMHKSHDGSGWQVLTSVVTADGTVVVTFDGSACPIVILKVNYTPVPAATVVTSPQTSDIG